MQEHLFRHFLSPDHNSFLNDISVTLIDKTDPSDPLKRENYSDPLKRTNNLSGTLMTVTPYGLNIEDSVWVLPFYNIEVGTFYSAHMLHFMDYWKDVCFRIGVMEDEFF